MSEIQEIEELLINYVQENGIVKDIINLTGPYFHNSIQCEIYMYIDELVSPYRPKIGKNKYKIGVKSFYKSASEGILEKKINKTLFVSDRITYHLSEMINDLKKIGFTKYIIINNLNYDNSQKRYVLKYDKIHSLTEFFELFQKNNVDSIFKSYIEEGYPLSCSPYEPFEGMEKALGSKVYGIFSVFDEETLIYFSWGTYPSNYKG